MKVLHGAIDATMHPAERKAREILLTKHLWLDSITIVTNGIFSHLSACSREVFLPVTPPAEQPRARSAE
jgi:hypothetical protein